MLPADHVRAGTKGSMRGPRDLCREQGIFAGTKGSVLGPRDLCRDQGTRARNNFTESTIVVNCRSIVLDGGVIVGKLLLNYGHTGQ